MINSNKSQLVLFDNRGHLTREIDIDYQTGISWHIRYMLGEYERLITSEDYSKALDLEKRKGSEQSLLNIVISRAIKKANRDGRTDLSKRLIVEFRDRGYDESWLNIASE